MIGIGIDLESEIGIGIEIGIDDIEMINISYVGNFWLVIYILFYFDLYFILFMNVIYIMFCFEWFNIFLNINLFIISKLIGIIL